MAALKLFALALLATSAFGKDKFRDEEIKNSAKHFEQKCLKRSLGDISGEIHKSLDGSILSFLLHHKELPDTVTSEENIMIDCVLEIDLKIEALVEKARKMVKDCGQDSLTDLEDVVRKAHEDNMKNLNHLEANHEFDTCNNINKNLQTGCKILETKFYSQLISNDLVVELINLIRQYSPEVQECIFEAVPGLKEDLNQIVADTEKCEAGL